MSGCEDCSIRTRVAGGRMWRALFLKPMHLDFSLKAVAWPPEVCKQKSDGEFSLF